MSNFESQCFHNKIGINQPILKISSRYISMIDMLYEFQLIIPILLQICIIS